MTAESYDQSCVGGAGVYVCKMRYLRKTKFLKRERLNNSFIIFM